MFTRREVLKLAGVSAAITARQVGAAPPRFWDVKPPAEWSADEVRSMLSDSPWATAGLVRDVGVVSLNTSAPWNGLPAKTKAWKVTVRWESAPSIQAALDASGEAVNEDFQKYYVISLAGDARVTGLLVEGRELGDKLSLLRKNTMLDPQYALPLQPEKLEEVSRASQRVLWYYFRRQAINADAGRMYCGTMIGRFRVLAKFDAENMLYHGRLAL